MTPRLSVHFSIFGSVFFVLKSLLGIERQWSLGKFAILTLKPLSHVRIQLIYRTWAITGGENSLLLIKFAGFSEISPPQSLLPSCILISILLFTYLLHPLWNHLLSVQSDWLSAMWFIPKSHHFLLYIASFLFRIQAFLFRLFNKPATRSIKY